MNFTNKKHNFGFHISWIMSVTTLITFATAILTPPLSGPYCKGDCYQYPYLDVASRFPRDYYWMYLAIIMLAVYVIFMAALHRHASEKKKIYSQAGISFALISATILLADYFVQLSVMQPSLLKEEFDGLSILSQYNPHGIFIALEELGYLLMSLSLFFMSFIFPKEGLKKTVSYLFFGGFILTMISLIAYSYAYGIFREYLFEVSSISINWLLLIVGGILCALIFKKSDKI